jgi:hypothetical protein
MNNNIIPGEPAAGVAAAVGALVLPPGVPLPVAPVLPPDVVLRAALVLPRGEPLDLAPVLPAAVINNDADAGVFLPPGEPLDPAPVLPAAGVAFRADPALLPGVPLGPAPVFLAAVINNDANAGVMDQGRIYSEYETLVASKMAFMAAHVSVQPAPAPLVPPTYTTNPNSNGEEFEPDELVTVSNDDTGSMLVIAVGPQYVLVQDPTGGFSKHHVDTLSHV